MIEEELFRQALIFFSVFIIILIGSQAISFYISSNKRIRFYNDVKNLVEKMVSLKKYYPPSYDTITLEIPKGCKIEINAKSDTIVIHCENITKIPLTDYNIDILEVVGGENCKIENGTLKEGKYKLTLAYVENISVRKECVVYFS